METLWTLLLCLLLFAGLISILFGLPGTLFIFFSALFYALVNKFERISGSMLLGLALLTLSGEGLEYVFGIIGARRFGASRKGITFSIIGGFCGAILGAPFLLGVGAVIGAFLGAFVGAVFIEMITRGPGGWRDALRSGLGSFVGRVLGMITKIALAAGMVVWILFKVF